MMADEKKISSELEVLNRFGIHARPAALLVKAANKFSCDIQIGKKGFEVSAKSIMGLLTIEGHQGARIMVHASGSDAEEAVREITTLFENKFFED
jgi:phosphocarrier protein HPr